MPTFRVTLVRKRRNPFNPADPLVAARADKPRIWPAIEASSETQVRELFDEAQARGLETVRGYKIHSITQVAP